MLQQLLGIFERQGIESANQESRNEYARDELSGMAPQICEQMLFVCSILSDEAFVRFVSLLKDDSLDDKAWDIICDAEKTRNADSESELKCICHDFKAACNADNIELQQGVLAGLELRTATEGDHVCASSVGQNFR